MENVRYSPSHAHTRTHTRQKGITLPSSQPQSGSPQWTKRSIAQFSEPCSNQTDCQIFPDPSLPHTWVFLRSRSMCYWQRCANSCSFIRPFSLQELKYCCSSVSRRRRTRMLNCGWLTKNLLSTLNCKPPRRSPHKHTHTHTCMCSWTVATRIGHTSDILFYSSRPCHVHTCVCMCMYIDYWRENLTLSITVSLSHTHTHTQGWGIVKTDVGMCPKYNLKDMIASMKANFVRLWTPDMCSKLVRRCRNEESRFYREDHQVFREGGSDEHLGCDHPFCPVYMLVRRNPRAIGQQASAVEVCRCRGTCGQAFHKFCFEQDAFISVSHELLRGCFHGWLSWASSMLSCLSLMIFFNWKRSDGRRK